MNVLIVDDSRLARKELHHLVSHHDNIHVVAEASNLDSAVAAINLHKPDLVLLDIHLPDGTGFDVLEQCDHTPQVIFTTAYEQHALQAFEVNALDYLLKPITQERLDTALKRLIAKPTPISTNPAYKNKDDQIFVRDGEKCHFIRIGDIQLATVEGNYVRLSFNNTKTLLNRSLNYLEEKLDPHIFFRANRQQIINMEFVKSIEPWIGDGLMIRLQDNTEIEVSRRQAKELKLKNEI